MITEPLKIQLFAQEDRDRQTFYIGKLKNPITFHFVNGMTFFVIIDKTFQELHICSGHEPEFYNVLDYCKNSRKKSIRSKHSNLSISLNPVKEACAAGKKLYVGYIRTDIDVSADQGLNFLIFLSDNGEEEMQISAPNAQPFLKNLKIVETKPVIREIK